MFHVEAGMSSWPGVKIEVNKKNQTPFLNKLLPFQLLPKEEEMVDIHKYWMTQNLIHL